MKLAQYASTHVERLLGRLVFEIKNALTHTTPDSIHDLRVAVRRFSQSLRVFEEILPQRAARQVRRQIRKIRDEAAAIRDGDVLAELFTRLRLAKTHAIFRQLENRRESEVRLLRQNLGDLCARDYSARWRAALFTAVSGGPDAEPYAREHLPGLTQKYFARGEKLVALPRMPEELHKFRIQTKRFRYTLEMFAELYGPVMQARLGRLQKVQALLGDLNDSAVALNTLRKIDPKHRLIPRLSAEAGKHEATFRQYWSEEFAQGEAERWTRYFERTPRKRRS